MKKYLLFLFALLTTVTVWAQEFIPLQMGENNGIELGPNESGKGYLSFTPEETDYYVFSTDADVSHYICINLWSDSYYDAYSPWNGPGYVPGEYTCDLGYLNKLNAGQTYLLRIAPQDDSLTGLAQVTVRKGYLVSPDAESADLTTLLSPLPVVAYEGQEVKLTVVSGATINSLTATTANGDPIALTVDDTGKVYSFTMPAADVTISGSGEIASLQLGDNEIDLTGEGTQFTFTPAESGAYVFSMNCGIMAMVTLSQDNSWLNYAYAEAGQNLTFGVMLEAGVTYTVFASISAESLEGAILNVAKRELAPIVVGENVIETPYGSYFDYSFTPQESGNYTFYTTGDAALYPDATLLLGEQQIAMCYSGAMDLNFTATLEAGETYTLKLGVHDGFGFAPLHLTVSTSGGPSGGNDPYVLQMGENGPIEFSGGVTPLSFTPEETDYYVFTTLSSVPHGFCINVWTDSVYQIFSEPAPFPGAHGCNLGYPQKLIAGQTYRLGFYPQQSDVTTQAYVFVRKGYLISTDAESEGLNHLLSPLPVAAYEGEEVKLNAPNTVIDNLIATANGEPIDIEINTNTFDGTTTVTFTMPAADVTISGSAHLATTEVNYVDGDGAVHTADALPLTGNETAIGMEGEERWYVADGEFNYTQTLAINGDVRLILADGAVINIGTEAEPVSGVGIDGSFTSSTLTVYGQTLDDDNAGHLNINTDDDCIYIDGDYAQHSGNVTLNSSDGCGASMWYNFTFTGGTLYIAVDKNAIYCDENVDILGGKLSAVSTGNYFGIYPLDGNVTLGWKNADDEITISNLAYGSSYCTMKIVDGQAFTDGENIYDSTTPSEVLWALANVTLRPVVPTFAITLPESFEHGTVTCDKETATVGEIVTLTVTPDQGYELETLTVTTIDATSGAPLRANVDLTPGENGTYTFEMPAAPVAVSASFKESTPTAVEYLNIDSNSGQRYNLMGQPVGKDYKGIVIEKGKKILVK